MATVWEFSRFVPSGKYTASGMYSGDKAKETGFTLENDTERALSDLPANTIVDAYEVGTGRVLVRGHGRVDYNAGRRILCEARAPRVARSVKLLVTETSDPFQSSITTRIILPVRDSLCQRY